MPIKVCVITHCRLWQVKDNQFNPNANDYAQNSSLPVHKQEVFNKVRVNRVVTFINQVVEQGVWSALDQDVAFPVVKNSQNKNIDMITITISFLNLKQRLE